MKLDSDEDTYSCVVAEGRAFSYVCHCLGRNGIEFFAKSYPSQRYLIYVDASCRAWLDNAIFALAAQPLI